MNITQINENNKYNGWKNRSTWLVKIHVDNTSKEVVTRAHEIAVRANTLKQFKNMLVGFLNDATPLLWKEAEFDIFKVDFMELWNSLEK